MSTRYKEQYEDDVMELLENNIVVFNDYYNTFDHVINSFIKVLGHSAEQAEQCATIIHNNGKCAVASGSFEDLLPKCSAILDRGISAEIA